MKRIIGNIAVLGCLAWGLNAYAWMDDWAPEFKCDQAEFEVLSKRSVSNFVGMVRSEYIETYWQYCEGYRLDLNDDGIAGNGERAVAVVKRHIRVLAIRHAHRAVKCPVAGVLLDSHA